MIIATSLAQILGMITGGVLALYMLPYIFDWLDKIEERREK